MENIDKSWMNLRRETDEYIRGVNDFLDFAFERAAQGKEIMCPCKKCMNCYWYYRIIWLFAGLLKDTTNGFFTGKDIYGENVHVPIMMMKVPACMTIMMAYFITKLSKF